MKTNTMAMPARVFQWRALVSVFLSLGFLVLAASGVVLFIRPSGRVAAETGWSMLGLDKDQWGNLHVWFAMVFVVGAACHLVFNWRPMVGYFKSRMTRGFSMRREWLVALIAGVLLAAGAVSDLPPFRSLSEWGHRFRHPAIAGSDGGHGENHEHGRGAGAEYGKTGQGGYGRRTIAETCAEEGIPIADGLARLKARGVDTQADATLREAADHCDGLHPREIITILRGGAGE